MVVHQKKPPLIIIREIVWKQEVISLIGTAYRLRTLKTGLGEGGGRTQLQLKYLYIQNLYKISIEKYDWSVEFGNK